MAGVPAAGSKGVKALHFSDSYLRNCPMSVDSWIRLSDKAFKLKYLKKHSSDLNEVNLTGIQTNSTAPLAPYTSLVLWSSSNQDLVGQILRTTYVVETQVVKD